MLGTPERKGQGANNSKRLPMMKMTEYASQCLSYIPPSPVSFLGSGSNGSLQSGGSYDRLRKLQHPLRYPAKLVRLCLISSSVLLPCRCHGSTSIFISSWKHESIAIDVVVCKCLVRCSNAQSSIRSRLASELKEPSSSRRSELPISSTGATREERAANLPQRCITCHYYHSSGLG